MKEIIKTLLRGESENHLMPFFWQRGEDEATLREYMKAICEANCGAVCVESRPHPDFCGEKWWQDMDVILDEPDTEALKEPVRCAGETLELKPWTRRLCTGIDYPAFGEGQAVTLPDPLAEEKPAFSGYARYESAFTLDGPGTVTLELTDAYEGVEIFVNGESAGIQIAPPFRYDLTALVKTGENSLAIEVATTLDRQCYERNKDDVHFVMRGLVQPSDPTGISGTVTVYAK